jgi:tight adherence protein C
VQAAVPFLLAMAMATSVFVLATRLMARRDLVQKQRSLANLQKYDSRKRSADVILVAKSNQILFGFVKRALPLGYREWLIKKVRAAGHHGREALDQTLNQKALYASVGLVLGGLMFTRGLETGATFSLLLITVGFFVPDILLINTAQKRELEIDKHLPDAIDLLLLCVDSGLTFEQAASRVSLGMDGPLAEEFGALIGEMQLGRSRSEALNFLMLRSKSVGLNKLLAALMQVDRLGIPLSAVLQEQARDMRARRRDGARETAQKVSVKILMPLMFCFLPAVLIIMIGPAILGLMQSFGSIG